MKRLTLFFPLVAVLISGCSRHALAEPKSTASAPPVKVELTTIKAENVPVITEITGTVRPLRRAQLAAKVMGAIEEMPVTLGQRVRSGDLLVKIAAGEVSARVTQAQSQFNAARRDLERERGLLEKGASTVDMVRGLEDRFTAAQAMVREAETMLNYTTLRAPFDGVIAGKLANAGDLASPGMPLLEIEGTSDFQVEAGIPESLTGNLEVGSDVAVEVPSSDQRFTGKIAELSSAADASALTVLAKIKVPADVNVRSGQFARVQIPGTPHPALVVPASAVSRLGQMQRVFVADDGNRAVLRLVRTGAARAQHIEITSGLDPNERVVVTPPVGLKEGQPLEVLP